MKKLFTFIILTFFMFTVLGCSATTTFNVDDISGSINKVGKLKEKPGKFDDELIDKLNYSFNKLFTIVDNNEDDFIISPISMYMAFSILHSAADDNVKQEIEELFSLNKEDFKSAKEIYEGLSFDIKDEFQSILKLTNSVWFDDRLDYNKDAMQTLADELYCYAYKEPFYKNNAKANKELRKFIKEMTNGVIDRDFDLASNTLMALVNTLYVQDNWDEFDLATKEMEFKNLNKNNLLKFIISNYSAGRTIKSEKCSYFDMKSARNIHLQLVVPNDCYSLNDIMNLEDLNIITNHPNYYYANDEKHYYCTRCIVPEFKIKNSLELDTVLLTKGYLKQAFTAYNTNLINDELKISRIIHDASLEINKKGLIGAAATIIASKDGSADPTYNIYEELIIDKPFMFVLKYKDIILFEGRVTNPIQ